MSKLTVNDPGIGVVGFRLRNRDGTDQASSGPFPTRGERWRGCSCRGRAASARIDQNLYGKPSTGSPAVACSFNATASSNYGLDESYFLYYEDVDFCRRATAAGWSVWFDPSLEATHHWPLHARRVPAPLRLMTGDTHC
ncbi:MAG: hypothetical protein U0792_06250 [Gemmataceae bacterium]